MPHKHQIFSSVALVLLLSACTPSDAMAQAGQAKQSAQGTSQPQVARAKLILEDAAKAMTKLKAFSYVAHAETYAPAASVFSAEVCGQRIDAMKGAGMDGGASWKLHSAGTVTGAAASTGGGSGTDAKRFTAANDGAASRSISEADKTVVEREDDSVGEIFSFFANFAKDAHETVFWEFLTDDALVKNHEFVNVTALEAPQTIDGKVCDAVYFGAETEAKKDEKDASGTTYVKRVFIARDDNLPRRIERLNVDKDGKMITGRTLEVRSLKVNDEAQLAAFSLEVPDGYRVKAAKLTRSAAKGEEKNDQVLAGPNGVTWAHDKKLLKVGSDAPAFNLKDAEGNAKTLADYKGKVVVMDFWATWCPPCRAVMPTFQKLHEKYKDKDVVILGMNAEMGQGNGDPVKFKHDNKYTYPTLLKAETAAGKYKVSGLPTFYLIDQTGKVAWGSVLKAPPNKPNAGYKELNEYIEEQLSLMIDAALEKAVK